MANFNHVSVVELSLAHTHTPKVKSGGTLWSAAARRKDINIARELAESYAGAQLALWRNRFKCLPK